MISDSDIDPASGWLHSAKAEYMAFLTILQRAYIVSFQLFLNFF